MADKERLTMELILNAAYRLEEEAIRVLCKHGPVVVAAFLFQHTDLPVVVWDKMSTIGYDQWYMERMPQTPDKPAGWDEGLVLAYLTTSHVRVPDVIVKLPDGSAASYCHGTGDYELGGIAADFSADFLLWSLRGEGVVVEP